MGGGVLPKLLHPVCWLSENLAASPGRHRRRQVVHALFPSSPSALPSSSLALTLFFLCSPRLSSSSSLFRPQIASFLLRASNPPQPWVNHLASYPYNSSNPSLDTHFAGNRRFPGRQPLESPELHLNVELPPLVPVFFTQQLESTLGEALMLVLSVFPRVLKRPLIRENLNVIQTSVPGG